MWTYGMLDSIKQLFLPILTTSLLLLLATLSFICHLSYSIFFILQALTMPLLLFAAALSSANTGALCVIK